MSAAIYISLSFGIVVGALHGLFIGAIITANQRKEQEDKITKLEKAGEDLSTVCWSIGCEMEDDNFYADEIESAGIRLKAASEAWHLKTFGEPIKPKT